MQIWPVSYTHLDVYKRQGMVSRVQSCREIIEEIIHDGSALLKI